MPSRASSLLLASLFLTLAPSMGQTAEKKVVYGYSFWKANSATEELTWTKIVEKLRNALGSAQQLNIYAGNCHSGGLITGASDTTSGLLMPSIIGTACAEAKTTTNGIARDDGVRLKIADGLGSFGYLEYAAKRLQGGMPMTKELHDTATALWKADGSYDANAPQYQRGKNADEALKLDAGTKASHALVFAGNYNNLRNREAPGVCAKALKDLGFTMGPISDTKTVRYYYSGTTTPGNLFGVYCYGPGTIAKFDAALDTLKSLMSADQGKVVVDLFLWGHGAEMQANARANPNAPPAGPGRGAHILASAQFDIPMSADAWTDLGEDVVADRPDWVRGNAPSFFLSVSDAHLDHPFSVTLGGIPLGSYTLSGGAAGALLQVPLDDATIRSLTLAHGGDTVLTAGFTLAAGDSMILALEDDITDNPSFQPGLFGTGLDLVVSRSVDNTISAPPPPRLPGTNRWEIILLAIAIATVSMLALSPIGRRFLMPGGRAGARAGPGPPP